MSESKQVSVKVVNNGPLIVKGESLTLTYCGEPVESPTGDRVFLCRCGQTKNPPFCDQSHRDVGFSAENPETPMRPVKVWEGKTIRTFFNPNACMHVFKCKPLKALRARELEGDVAAADEIARVVMSCPSGALTYESTTASVPQAESGPMIEIMEGGEIRVQCDFEINAELQERQPADRATLCRCGLSNNKPWCDGRHKKRDDFR